MSKIKVDTVYFGDEGEVMGLYLDGVLEASGDQYHNKIDEYIDGYIDGMKKGGADLKKTEAHGLQVDTEKPCVVDGEGYRLVDHYDLFAGIMIDSVTLRGDIIERYVDLFT